MINFTCKKLKKKIYMINLGPQQSSKKWKFLPRPYQSYFLRSGLRYDQKLAHFKKFVFNFLYKCLGGWRVFQTGGSVPPPTVGASWALYQCSSLYIFGGAQASLWLLLTVHSIFGKDNSSQSLGVPRMWRKTTYYQPYNQSILSQWPFIINVNLP
jgi:hypothetical protein